MKEGLIYISDRLGQLRYSDGNEKSRWLQPLSSYKALKTIKRGQAVSVATVKEIESILQDDKLEAYRSDPSPYIVPTNTKIHNRCIGLALENAELDGEVHILSSGQFEYDSAVAVTGEYNPKFTSDDISKKIYVSDKEGELTTSSETAYKEYKNIIQIGHIIDAPNSTKTDQKKTILEVQIQGDDRGILESTQFEAVLGEDVFIKADEPLTVFAFGQEEASKFKIKLCTRNMNTDDTNSTDNTIDLDASFIVIKKLSGEYCLIKFSDKENIETDDTTDRDTLELLNNRYECKATTTINDINFNDSLSSIKAIKSALNAAIKGMGENLKFTDETSTSEDGNYSNVTLELNENGGYYDIYISNSLRDFLRDTVTLQNGSLHNKNTAVLADIRVDARRNVFGVLVNDYEKDITLTKGSRILLMRQGELVINTERTLTAVGKKFVLGESGAVICADDALRTADSSNTIGYLKKVHKEGEEKNHYHFVIDIGENIPKVEYSTYPVGYLKPYYGDRESPTPDFGYLVTGGTYEIEEYKELYERLLGWYSESDINASDNGHSFNIPLIEDKNGTPMQIKYVTDGIFERLPKVPYLRDFGNISETNEHVYSIKDLDITALLSINTTFSEVDTLPLERLDIHLYIDPDYTEGEHNWREVHPGFYKYNNVDTYGFEWKLKKEVADGENIYGKYILSANIGDGRGIYYVSSKNVAPISCKNVPYKLYIAVKQTNIEHFDLRNLMSNYISNTIYNGNGQVDDIYAVTGEAVVNAIRNNKWFNTLKNFDENAIIDFGGERKLDTTVNIQTNKDIRLNCKIVSEEPEETQGNAVLIGETEDKENHTTYTTLEIKDGKAFLNKLNDNLFKFENGQLTSARNEVATVNDILDHALMSIDDSIKVEDVLQSSAGYDKGRIHGMKFGKDGNVNASKLCNFEVGIAHGQSWENISEALIPIIYKYGNDVHTPLQGYLDYYTNTVNDNETTKLFTLYPKYETDEEVLDLEFKKDKTNNIEKISFGGATLIAPTEAPSLSKYKTIYSENKIERDGQFNDNLDKGSKPGDGDNISFDFAYILQAAYELPMAYWKYRDSNEYNIGPIIERLQDTINYFEKDGDITYKVDGDETAYKYTSEQKAGIAKSLKDIISESGKSVRVDDMVGFLLAAAGETQKRLAKLERSTYGRDVMDDGETKIGFTNMPEVNSKHTYYGLNRLVRAICLELFGKANPDELKADEATLTSLSRMDSIERQIRGSRNNPDEDGGSITNNSINDFDAADPDNDDINYSISSSYPYREDIEDPENNANIKNEDICSVADNNIIETKETILGTEPAKDKDSFNGVVDAIYRITQKVDVLTKAVNGTNDILQPHTTLNKIKRNIETLIKEVYFDGADDPNTAYKDELGKGELFDKDGTKSSRVDEITKELYEKTLEYKNWATDEYGNLTETRDGTVGPTLSGYEGAKYDGSKGELTISSPTNIYGYKDNLSIIDIILKAIGNQILLKHYNGQNGSAENTRFNKDISQRLYDIEQCLDKIVLKLKDNNNFESFESTNDIETILNLDDFNDALSKLLGYTPTKDSGNDKFAPSKGVVPGKEDNNGKFSAEYAVSSKSNIVAGLENLLYRVQNEEKDNLHIKKFLGNDLEKGVIMGDSTNTGDATSTLEPNVKSTEFTLSDDIKDLLATIYGEADSNAIDAGDNTYYRHRTKARVTSGGGSFLNGDNIIENIVNELYYIPQPLNSNLEPIGHENLELKNDAIYVNYKDNVNSSFFTGSLINGTNRDYNFKPVADGGRKSRLDILESDVRALRKFIGLANILSSNSQGLSTIDKKTVAIDGEFSFSKDDDDGRYFVNGGSYEIGTDSTLKTSFIESFFNLMKRVDNLNENILADYNENITDNKAVYSAIVINNQIASIKNDIGTAGNSIDSLKDSIDKATAQVISLESSVGDDTRGLTQKANELTKSFNDLDSRSKDVENEINSFVIATSSLKVAKAREILADFTVTGTQNFVISAPEGKNYHCKVSFILDPKCEYIGSDNTDNGNIIRKENINRAIKDVDPLCKYGYEDLPRWKSNEEAKNDINAYVVYNKSFSNMFSLYNPSDLNMESELNNSNGIYCGISKDNDKNAEKIGCLPHINRVGCLMSDLIIYDKSSDTTTATQYTPFYFELVYVPRPNNSNVSDWKFSWEVESNTEDT